MQKSSFKIDFVKFHATIALFFLFLGLSPITRIFSIFDFFEPEIYFIPQYAPYLVSVLASVSALMYLRGNKSKIYVAFMTMILRACIALSVIMICYFLFTFMLVYLGGSAIPEYCTFQNGFSCQSSWLSSHKDKLELSLINGLNKPMVVTHVSCSTDRNQAEQCDSKRCRKYDSEKGGVELHTGAATGFILRCTDHRGEPLFFRKGDHYVGKLIVKFYYLGEDKTNIRKLVGSIGVKAS